MELWQQILALTLTPTIIVGAIAFLIRSAFDRSLQRDLERFKSELGIQRFEHETRFSIVQERRAEVIANLYGYLAKARRLMAQLTSIIQINPEPLLEKKKRAADACNVADEYFNEHRIYLSRETSAKVEEVLELLKSAFIDFDTAQNGDEYKADPSGFWRKAYSQVKNELPPLLEEMEVQFQEILGIKERRDEK